MRYWWWQKRPGRSRWQLYLWPVVRININKKACPKRPDTILITFVTHTLVD
jgi:hypothetical protein